MRIKVSSLLVVLIEQFEERGLFLLLEGLKGTVLIEDVHVQRVRLIDLDLNIRQLLPGFIASFPYRFFILKLQRV